MLNEPRCVHDWHQFNSLAYGKIWTCQKCHIVSQLSPDEIKELWDAAAIDRYEENKIFREE